ncbi:uncharacterized protein LOC143011678 [Genypterus blacodes]|uniref:uncharacterized protein LOC143011678 n=1 Tax=Genypterus blacodes TaxID=154954 RepID=UPI003F7743F5
MPLFKSRAGAGAKKKKPKPCMGKFRKTDEDGSVLSLGRLCLLSLAENMKMWVKDYEEKYMDQYVFRYIMGPFNILPSELLEELTCLLTSRKLLSRAALHLLLVPQLRVLALSSCPGLATSALCTLIGARCQALWSLDLSGVQQLPSKVLSETLCCLPSLRSLSLAGTPCDRAVIRTIAHHCPLLRHLDVSRCHFLSPAALLPLVSGVSCSSSGCPCRSKSHSSPSTSDGSSSFSSALSPLPISSLLALDIGFGEEEGEPVAAAAYLLLSLPYLERVALVGLAQACSLIHRRDFSQTDEFTSREAVPRLEEVWMARLGADSKRAKAEGAAGKEDDDAEEEGDRRLWDGYGSESEDKTGGDAEERSSRRAHVDDRGRVASQSAEENLTLRLRDVRGVHCASLQSFAPLCPDIHSFALDFDADQNNGGLPPLASWLQTWSGQLRSLSVHYPGNVTALLPAVRAVGSSLVSLTLEGVKTSSSVPLQDLMRACPKLRDLLICANPPTIRWLQDREEDERGDQHHLHLPDLRSLTLNFSYDHSQMKPPFSMMSLKWTLRCLLSGSPLLEKISLVSLPCPLNSVLHDIHLRAGGGGQVDSQPGAAASDPPRPLSRVQHLVLTRTDVTMATLKSIMQRCKMLEYVDVSYCCQISQAQSMSCEPPGNVKLVWK